MNTILIADDEQTFLDFMVRLLQKDHRLLIARNWNEVLEKFESNLWRLNASILDVNMPGLSVDPYAMVDKLLKSNPTVPMIIISGQDIVLRHEFLKMGVFQYHGKPIDMMDLKLTIQSALEYNRVLRRLENYDKVVRDEVIFYQRLLNINLNDVRERIESHDASTKKTPILIRSEPGTRPNMLAKIISKEIDGKLFFYKVCSESLKNIIPHNLQNGDTLYLEGIEHLERDEQVFLLQAVKDKKSDNGFTDNNLPQFRLIASISTQLDNELMTNPELSQLVDLLAEIEFRIEPLRYRKHELKNIISLVFDRKKKENFAKPHSISEDLYTLFIDYNWPLNYIELDIIIESLLLTCSDTILLPKHLHQLDFSDIANSKYPTLDDMVDEHIKKALRLTMGNKSRAAKMLGITPKTLYSRIRH
ncbi:MAG: sigma-54-dependent transcriptional regulator [bacterium]